MKGRMIHTVEGKEESQIYDPIRNQVSLSYLLLHNLAEKVFLVYQLDLTPYPESTTRRSSS